MRARRSLVILFAMGAMLFGRGYAHAVAKSWASAVSGNWNSAANWSPAGVPALGDDVSSLSVTLGNDPAL